MYIGLTDEGSDGIYSRADYEFMVMIFSDVTFAVCINANGASLPNRHRAKFNISK